MEVSQAFDVRCRRVYEDRGGPEYRVLVDRLWPRDVMALALLGHS